MTKFELQQIRLAGEQLKNKYLLYKGEGNTERTQEIKRQIVQFEGLFMTLGKKPYEAFLDVVYEIYGN